MNEEKKRIEEGVAGLRRIQPPNTQLIHRGGGSGRRFCARVHAGGDGDESLLDLHQVHSSSRQRKNF